MLLTPELWSPSTHSISPQSALSFGFRELPRVGSPTNSASNSVHEKIGYQVPVITKSSPTIPPSPQQLYNTTNLTPYLQTINLNHLYSPIMVAQPISEPTLSLPANPVQQPDQESSKAQTPPMDPALTAPSPPHSENDVEQQLLPAHILGPAPTHPSLVHALPPPPPIVPITTPGSAIQPKFNSSPHLSGYRTTIKSSDLTPVNAPPRERKYKIVSATSHKDALPVLVGSPTNSGRHKRSAEEAELSEMDVDSEGRGSPLVMAPNSGAAAKTAEEIKREKNRESQRRSRQRKHQTLETFQTEVERLLREKEDMREQLLRERDEWKERALRAEARFPLQPSPEKESPPANLV